MFNCKMCLNKPICKYIPTGESIIEQVKKIPIETESPFTLEPKCEREVPGQIKIGG